MDGGPSGGTSSVRTGPLMPPASAAGPTGARGLHYRARAVGPETVAAEAEQATPGAPGAPGAGHATPRDLRRRAWARVDPVLVGVTLAGLAARVWGLGGQSLWYDEWLTQEAMDGGPGHLVRHVADREGIPLPYFALLWLWTRLAGDGEVALRTVSLVAGVAAIPVAYALARRVVADSRWPARAAALLVAVNPLAVWYSQEARPYALLCLAGGLVVLAAVQAGGQEPPARRDVVLLALAAAAAVAVHYFAVVLVAAAGIGLLVVRRPAWRTWLLAGVPTVVVLVALAPLAVRQHSHDANRDWITTFPLLDLAFWLLDFPEVARVTAHCRSGAFACCVALPAIRAPLLCRALGHRDGLGVLLVDQLVQHLLAGDFQLVRFVGQDLLCLRRELGEAGFVDQQELIDVAEGRPHRVLRDLIPLVVARSAYRAERPVDDPGRGA